MSELDHAQTTRHISVTVNGTVYESDVLTRTHLGDFLRQELGLTGTHLGCEHGVCGACTIILDGQPIRSCLMLAVQANGATIRTIEGLAQADGTLHPLQQKFLEMAALQCGICTPGFIVAAKALLDRNPDPTETEVRFWLAGNLCRCTGYDKIIRAVMNAAAKMREEAVHG
jgi:carbon-monoxide dehydrogenase small subunit